MKITEEEIKRISSATIYRRGVEYLKEGRVHIKTRGENEIVSIVDGEEVYNVSIHFSQEGKVKDSFCSCPYYTTMNCTCKHIVATLKVRQKELLEGAVFLDENDKYAKKLCARYENLTEGKTHLNALFTVKISRNYQGRMTYNIEIAVGEGVPQPVSGAERFLSAYAGEGEYKLSKFKSFERDNYYFSENETAILDVLSESCQNKLSSYAYTPRLTSTEIGALTFKRLMPYFEKVKCDFCFDEIKLVDMQIKHENPDIQIDVQATDMAVSVSVIESGYSLTKDGEWFLYSGDIYKTTPDWRESYMPLYEILNGGTRTRIEFCGENKIAFASYALPRLKKLSGAVFNGIDEVVVDEKPVFDIYFDCQGKAVSAVVIASYGTIPIKIPTMHHTPSDKIIIRNIDAENAILSHFGAFYVKDAYYLLDDSNEIYRFITDELETLRKCANIIESDSFAELLKLSKPNITANVSYKKDIDLLEVSFESDLSAEEMEGILSAVRLKQPFYRNKKGRFISLDSDNDTANILAEFGFGEEDVKAKRKSLSKYHALYLSYLARVGKIAEDDSFSELIESVKSIAADIPDDIDKILRAYQRDAVNWMTQLSALGFGGILADDMGLGKTLEVIAFVMSQKPTRPALVVAPSSLLYNWQSEINRFAPNAKAVIIDGTRQERLLKLELISDEDFVITSYPLLRRDIAEYKNIEFSFCFIDEAQYIKNPKTMNAKGVKQIRAKQKFALTGTPVENSLSELWSIFDFVMTGYFGKRREFSENYEKPIAAGHPDASGLLKNKIKPFVMRRMKKDVLDELPDKIENTIFADMEEKQRQLYDAYLAVARREVDRILSEGDSDIMILSLITRLRQICCHPALFDDAYEKESGKLELLIELLHSAIGSGHRVLVFSQFTSMLKIIRERLDKEGISAFYLDGKTPSYERLELADRFCGGEKDVFLVSLKAGGTGLNLTGADMVIHYDPWWNPAVTDQASDRAYRIGQTKAVQVIRLASHGTIEEQILKLQDKKRELADGIIVKNSASLSNLTNEEILSLFE